jgi:hypothetical protein
VDPQESVSLIGKYIIKKYEMKVHKLFLFSSISDFGHFLSSDVIFWKVMLNLIEEIHNKKIRNEGA